MLRNTIKAKNGYRVIEHDNIPALFDGDRLIMEGCTTTMAYHNKLLTTYDSYHVCAIIQTIKGGQYIYARDEEFDLDYLVKAE